MAKQKFYHYVYVLHHKGKPFYIGISIDPVKRLFMHFREGGGDKKSRYFARVKSISDISIIIVDKITTEHRKPCINCHKLEQKWICQYLKEGHKLTNTLIKFYQP